MSIGPVGSSVPAPEPPEPRDLGSRRAADKFQFGKCFIAGNFRGKKCVRSAHQPRKMKSECNGIRRWRTTSRFTSL